MQASMWIARFFHRRMAWGLHGTWMASYHGWYSISLCGLMATGGTGRRVNLTRIIAMVGVLLSDCAVGVGIESLWCAYLPIYHEFNVDKY